MAGLQTMFKDIAESLLKEHGASATFKSMGEGTYNNDTSTIAENLLSSTAVKVALQGYSAHVIDGTRIQVNDQRAFMHAKNVSAIPKPGDVLVVLGADWRVISVLPTYYKDSVVLYELQIRR